MRSQHGIREWRLWIAAPAAGLLVLVVGVLAAPAAFVHSEKLTGGGEVGKGEFGTSVAISQDGNTALVGGPDDAPHYNTAGNFLVFPGAAWVFTRSGSTWAQQGGKLGGRVAEERNNVCGLTFGESVALSSDGNTALIGGPDTNECVGAAWVFTRSGSTWTEQAARLIGSGHDEAGGFFGETVALSADGNTALIGGVAENKYVGAAWVFTRSGSTWTQQGEKLTGAGEIGEGGFGSVALSSDGNTALIGGGDDNHNAGAAWVFTRSGSTWTQQGEKLAGGGSSGESSFGGSVALSSDGNTALVGAPGGFSRGMAWEFKRSASIWTRQRRKLVGHGERGKGRFGYSVALSGDGSTAVIGGRSDTKDVGAAWVVTR